MANKHNLLLQKSKHKRLILKRKKRRKNSNVKMIKWLEIIMDESLTFKEYWKARILKVRNILGRCKGIGNS